MGFPETLFKVHSFQEGLSGFHVRTGGYSRQGHFTVNILLGATGHLQDRVNASHSPTSM